MLETMFAEIESASELRQIKGVLRNRALSLIEDYFALHPGLVTNEEEGYGLPLIDEEVQGRYGDPAQLIGLGPAGYIARARETDEHSDHPYNELNTDTLLEVLEHLEAINHQEPAG
jgi:hypothetical protein